MLVCTSTWALARGRAEDDCMLSGKRRFTTLRLLNVLSVFFHFWLCFLSVWAVRLRLVHALLPRKRPEEGENSHERLTASF